VFDSLEDLPPLDTHAHLAPDVTEPQLRRLGGAEVIGMTRSLAEADYVKSRADESVTWGLGVHPTGYDALRSFDASEFERLIEHFAVIGEVGLDFRGGPRQLEVFREILRVAAARPVLLSVHSTGMVQPVLDAVAVSPHRGTILHWFMGNPEQIKAAADLGCHFSVNAAMTDEQLSALPRDRVLPETDFPAGGKAWASRPGDTVSVEVRLAKLWALESGATRHRLYANLRGVAVATGAIDRLSSRLASHLLAA
jgi:TatD DNase family protein